MEVWYPFAYFSCSCVCGYVSMHARMCFQIRFRLLCLQDAQAKHKNSEALTDKVCSGSDILIVLSYPSKALALSAPRESASA